MTPLPADLRAIARKTGALEARADSERWDGFPITQTELAFLRDTLDGEIAAEAAADELARQGDRRLLHSENWQHQYAFQFEDAYMAKLISLVDVVERL